MITLQAKDGYIYTNGQIYSKIITVSEEKVKEFYEISEEEFNERGITSMM